MNYNQYSGIWSSDESKSVYLFKGGGAYKIGISNCPEQRLYQLNDSNRYVFDISPVAAYSSIYAFDIEQKLHADFRFLRAKMPTNAGLGADGITEWFALPEMFESRFADACCEAEKLFIKQRNFIPYHIKLRMRDFSPTPHISMI